MWDAIAGRVLLVVAHPDDETLACAGAMLDWKDCTILHTTNGSPRRPRHAENAGFATREAYAAARRLELECALGQIGGRDTRCLDLNDQESWADLAALSLQVEVAIEEIDPATVITHPYEGGHPDHDAAAFAVQKACALRGNRAPRRVEAAFYNRYEGQFRGNEFLPGGPPEIALELDTETQALKKAMFACFTSQASVLAMFSTSVERFRMAPDYTFKEPPHPGPLNYETLGWGITSAAWLTEASRAMRQLDA